MTREELLDLVNGKVDTTKFKSLSKKTINEEVDDVLEDMGNDESLNDKLVTKLANRLKRMDGNLHKNVSDEMKKNKEAEDARKKQDEEEKKIKQEEEDENSAEAELIKRLTERLDAMEKANNERAAKAAKEATMDAVKKGLKDKFEKAGLELNNFFAKTALSKLDISGENVDVNELVAKAEKLYNADVKDAGYVPNSKPHNGGGSGDPQDEDKMWDDIASLRKRD